MLTAKRPSDANRRKTDAGQLRAMLTIKRPSDANRRKADAGQLRAMLAIRQSSDANRRKTDAGQLQAMLTTKRPSDANRRTTDARRLMKAGKTVFTMDRHAVVVRDLVSALPSMGAKALNHADAAYAGYYPLERASQAIGFDSSRIPRQYDFATMERMAKTFPEAVRALDADYFYCGYNTWLFHLYSRCEAPTILNLYFRLEGGYQPSAENFDRLIEKTLRLMDDKKLFAHACCDYDIAYFKYFTGRDISRMPLRLAYMDNYQWREENVCHKEILMFPVRGPMVLREKIHEEYGRWFRRNTRIKLRMYGRRATPLALTRSNIKAPLALARSAMTRAWHKTRRALNMPVLRLPYAVEDVLRHKAAVFFPHSVYSGQMLEFMKMGVPMFFPSKKLMSEWHLRYGALNEKTSTTNKGKNNRRTRGGFSGIVSQAAAAMPDPNNNLDKDAVDFWLDKCEWYRRNVMYFDSPADLREKLRICDYAAMSRALLDEQSILDNLHKKRWARYLG